MPRDFKAEFENALKTASELDVTTAHGPISENCLAIDGQRRNLPLTEDQSKDLSESDNKADNSHATSPLRNFLQVWREGQIEGAPQYVVHLLAGQYEGNNLKFSDLERADFLTFDQFRQVAEQEGFYLHFGHLECYREGEADPNEHPSHDYREDCSERKTVEKGEDGAVGGLLKTRLKIKGIVNMNGESISGLDEFTVYQEDIIPDEKRLYHEHDTSGTTSNDACKLKLYPRAVIIAWPASSYVEVLREHNAVDSFLLRAVASGEYEARSAIDIIIKTWKHDSGLARKIVDQCIEWDDFDLWLRFCEASGAFFNIDVVGVDGLVASWKRFGMDRVVDQFECAIDETQSLCLRMGLVTQLQGLAQGYPVEETRSLREWCAMQIEFVSKDIRRVETSDVVGLLQLVKNLGLSSFMERIFPQLQRQKGDRKFRQQFITSLMSTDGIFYDIFAYADILSRVPKFLWHGMATRDGGDAEAAAAILGKMGAKRFDEKIYHAFTHPVVPRAVLLQFCSKGSAVRSNSPDHEDSEPWRKLFSKIARIIVVNRAGLLVTDVAGLIDIILLLGFDFFLHRMLADLRQSGSKREFWTALLNQMLIRRPSFFSKVPKNVWSSGTTPIFDLIVSQTVELNCGDVALISNLVWDMGIVQFAKGPLQALQKRESHPTFWIILAIELNRDMGCLYIPEDTEWERFYESLRMKAPPSHSKHTARYAFLFTLLRRGIRSLQEDDLFPKVETGHGQQGSIMSSPDAEEKLTLIADIVDFTAMLGSLQICEPLLLKLDPLVEPFKDCANILPVFFSPLVTRVVSILRARKKSVDSSPFSEWFLKLLMSSTQLFLDPQLPQLQPFAGEWAFAPVGCGCEDCNNLDAFLADGQEEVHCFAIPHSNMQHLSAVVHDNRTSLLSEQINVGNTFSLQVTKAPELSRSALLAKAQEQIKSLATSIGDDDMLRRVLKEDFEPLRQKMNFHFTRPADEGAGISLGPIQQSTYVAARGREFRAKSKSLQLPESDQPVAVTATAEVQTPPLSRTPTPTLPYDPIFFSSPIIAASTTSKAKLPGPAPLGRFPSPQKLVPSKRPPVVSPSKVITLSSGSDSDTGSVKGRGKGAPVKMIRKKVKKRSVKLKTTRELVAGTEMEVVDLTSD